MKKWIKWCSATVIALLAVLLVDTLSSCNHASLTEHSMSEYVDSADLAKVLGDISNPTFKSVDDAITYHQLEKQSRSNDSVFFSLSPEVITNVYSVLVKRDIVPTKTAIVSEYLENVKVYSNLPRHTHDIEVPLDSVDVPNTKVVDTIINGQHIKVLQEKTTSMQRMNVICVCYDGSEVSDETVNSIVAIVTPFAKNKSKVLVNRYDNNDIAGVISAVSLKTICCETTEKPVDVAIESAARYISKRFESFFKNHVLLALSMVEVKNSHSEESTIFKNAASIILENRYSPVLEKHGITPEIVEVIKNVNM